jgi:N-acetylglucosaminyldiphosphoundecaprenol N-acetyl-beta-D-mannosaminyltransferase
MPLWPSITMATQHPDNAGKPWWNEGAFVSTPDEITELITLFQETPIEEYMWDWEGKLVDGFGLWGMLRLVGVKTTRVTGMDLAEALVRLAAERGWKMGLIGGGPGQAEAAKRKWQAVFPALPIHAEEGGRVQPDGAVDEAGEEAKLRLTLFAPEVLLVAFGHPKQETWIRQALHEFPSVRVAVGVGGTLDVWGGSLRRAPMLMRRLGLEWMWRLWQEPHRLGRIWRAVVVFPLMFVFDWWKPKT